MYVYRDRNASAIADHAWTSHHGVNWEAKVLNVSDIICLLECWLMMNHPDGMNKRYISLSHLRLMTSLIII